MKNTKTFGCTKGDELAKNYFRNNLEKDNVDSRTGSIRILKVIDVCNGKGCSSGILLGNSLLFIIREKKML